MCVCVLCVHPPEVWVRSCRGSVRECACGSNSLKEPSHLSINIRKWQETRQKTQCTTEEGRTFYSDVNAGPYCRYFYALVASSRVSQCSHCCTRCGYDCGSREPFSTGGVWASECVGQGLKVRSHRRRVRGFTLEWHESEGAFTPEACTLEAPGQGHTRGLWR